MKAKGAKSHVVEICFPKKNLSTGKPGKRPRSQFEPTRFDLLLTLSGEFPARGDVDLGGAVGVEGDGDPLEGLVAALGAEHAGHEGGRLEARVAAEDPGPGLPDQHPRRRDHVQVHLFQHVLEKKNTFQDHLRFWLKSNPGKFSFKI